MAALALTVAAPASAGAAEFRARLLDDRAPDGCATGGCTLREAIQAANDNPGRDVVVLRPRVTYRLELPGAGEDDAATGDLDVTDPVTILAAGRGRARIDARGLDRALDLHADAELEGLAITNGRLSPGPDAEGSAVRAGEARMTLRDSAITDNDGPASAIALAGARRAVVRKSTVARNWGDGIAAEVGGELRLARTEVSYNTGHGVRGLVEDAMAIRHSRLRGNGLSGAQEAGPGDLFLVDVTARRNGRHGAEEDGDGGLYVRRSRVRANGAIGLSEAGAGPINGYRLRVADNERGGARERDVGDVGLKQSRLARNGGLGIDESGPGGAGLEESTIDRSSDGAISERDDGGIELSIAKLRRSGGDGVVERGEGVVILTRALIRGHAGVGLRLEGDANALRSRIVGNEGGIEHAGGRLVLSRSTVARNQGAIGGIAATGPAQVDLKGVTIGGNSTTGAGGGVMLAGAAELEAVNSTIAGNRSDGAGGGIYAGAEATVNANAITVARNTADDDDAGFEPGGGLAVEPGARAELRNSLLGLNASAGSGPDCSGLVDSGGGNLVARSAGCEGLGPADRTDVAPRIGPLALNGGPTATVALRRRSPAIGIAGPDAPARDQRGVGRDDPDAGAFERVQRR